MKALHKDREGRLYAYQDKQETLDYTIDMTRWLDGDEIASVAHKTSGVTLTDSSNTTTAYTIWVTGTDGYVETLITTSTTPARKKQRTVFFREKVA